MREQSPIGQAATDQFDLGTRQWSPEDEIAYTGAALQRQLQARRAGRVFAAPAGGEREASQARITLSYRDLLQALSIAAVDQRGVTLTVSGEKVRLALTDVHDPVGALNGFAEVSRLELALRDRLEQVIARRSLETFGVDFVIGEDPDFDSASAPTERLGM